MIILFTILLLLLPASLMAANLYVDQSIGNDTTGTGTEAQPWATIQKCENTMANGDTCFVKNGTYAPFTINVSGTQAAPRIFKNFPGHAPIVRATTNGNTITLANGNDTIAVAWIEIEGFDIQSTSAVRTSSFCVRIISAQNFTLRKNKIHNCGQGFLGYGYRVTIERNLIYDNDEHGIYGTGTEWVIANNIIYSNNAGYGLQGAGYPVGQSPTPGPEYMTWRNNLIYGNTFAYNWYAGIVSWQSGANSNNYYNNIFYENCVSGAAGASQGIQWQSSGGSNILRNNLFFATSPGCTNDFASNVGTVHTEFNGVRSNPLVVTGGGSEPGSPDFHLQSGSPALNAGFNAGRFFNGAAPEIGAYEDLVHATCSVENATPAVINITYTNNVYPPLLPSTGITGYSARENGGAKTVSSAVRAGDNQVNVTVSAAFSAGNTIDYSWSGGNLTDSALIGGTLNQSLRSISNQSCTNNVSGASSAVLTQTAFRFHDVRGTEASPVVKPYPGAANNLNITSVPGGKVRLRLKVACTVADCDPLGMALRYSRNGGSYTAVPDSFDADNLRFYGVSSDADIPTSGTDTTELLTSSHATNVACAIVRAANSVPTVDLSQNSETECEYAIELDSDAAANDTYDFRLYNQSGAALSAYSVTPRLTVVPMAAGGGM